jgi:homocysteine S-methyltransferase
VADIAPQRIAQRLARDAPLVLDGGLATELQAQGHTLDSTLWSAGMLQTNPQAISDAHRAFLDAGADCIITSSYQASQQGFVEKGVPAPQADQLLKLSIELAVQAVDAYEVLRRPGELRPLVAASVGPYGASMHDGSEYRGQYGIGKRDLMVFHEGRLRLLDSAGADILACETIPSADEAQVLRDLLLEVSTPAWISFSCSDGMHICDGTRLRDVAALFAGHSGVFAVGINCTAPWHIDELIGEVKRGAPDKAIVVYPNSGEDYRLADKTWHGDALHADLAAASVRWFDAGATLIGGCCRVRPDDIRKMRQALKP